MGYANIAQALAVVAVVALLLAVAAFPFIDRMDSPTPTMVAQETPCAMSEAPEGYSARVTLGSLTTGILPTASVQIEEGEDVRTVLLTSGDALCWLTDVGIVLATASGVSTPAYPSGMPEGSTVEISAGAVVEGDDSLPFTRLLVPSSGGDMGLYLEAFRLTSLSSMWMVAGQHVGYGPASSVQPTDGSEGTFTAEYTAGDGSIEVTGGSYELDGETAEASAFVAPATYYSPGEDTEDSPSKIIWKAVPLVLLVALLGYLGAVAWRNLR